MEDEIVPIGSGPLPEALQPTGGTQQTASDAFGVGFEDLLSIVLTQLTFQDPLKPIDNFEFVSQLAQFTQIQQTEEMNDHLLAILQSDAAGQATGLLGRTVDIPAGPTVLTGRVTTVSFENGEPRITIETEDERTISNIGLGSITQVRQGE